MSNNVNLPTAEPVRLTQLTPSQQRIVALIYDYEETKNQAELLRNELSAMVAAEPEQTCTWPGMVSATITSAVPPGTTYSYKKSDVDAIIAELQESGHEEIASLLLSARTPSSGRIGSLRVEITARRNDGEGIDLPF
jgi:hypothetical protein